MAVGSAVRLGSALFRRHATTNRTATGVASRNHVVHVKRLMILDSSPSAPVDETVTKGDLVTDGLRSRTDPFVKEAVGAGGKPLSHKARVCVAQPSPVPIRVHAGRRQVMRRPSTGQKRGDGDHH